MIPNSVLNGTVPGLTPTLIAVYAAFRRYAFDGRLAYPGNDTIARILDVGEKTVRRSLDGLERLGLIRRPGDRRGRRGPAIVEFLERTPMSGLEVLERTSGAPQPDISGSTTGHPCPHRSKTTEEDVEEAIRAADAIDLEEARKRRKAGTADRFDLIAINRAEEREKREGLRLIEGWT